MSLAPDVVRVLHVGLDGDRAERTADRLEREDDRFDVELAAGPEAALERLGEAEFDCVVSEHDPPDLDAIDAVERVRERRPDLPFVLVVEGESEGVGAEALDAGATDIFRRGSEARGDAVLANRIANAVRSRRTDGAAGRPAAERRAAERDGGTADFPRRVDIVNRALEIANVGAWEYDLRTERLTWTEQVYRIFGRSPNDDLTLEAAIDGYHPDDRERVRDAFERACREGEPYDLEARLVTAEDGPRWVRTRGDPQLGGEDGTEAVIRVRGTVQDITDRKQRELAVEALHEIATSIQNAESVETACEQTVAAAANVLDFYMCSVVLREGDWLVPYAISEDSPPDGSRRMRTDQGLAGKTFQSGESYVIDEVSGRESDPAKPSYRSGLSVPIGDVGVFQAVSTEPGDFDERDVELAELLVSHTANAIGRIEREAELQRQNDRLDRFASIVSHDLRNPLSVASGRLRLAREEHDSGTHLAEIERAHDRMEQLIDDLLQLAREGERAIEPESIALDEVVEAAWQSVETDGATIAVETARSMRADRSRLRQLLENLLRNATEHGGDDVAVTVGALEDGFYVEDDGPGIPEATREEVFDAGYSTSENGTGLGLSIVERTADAHGWELRATEGSRGGARFEITDVELTE